MRKIIDGKVYDTRTSRLLGAWQSPGMSRRDFSYYEEDLYVNRKGAYFLHGEGGAMSSYATHSGDGNSSGGGEQLIPMTKDEAMAWAETALSADEYEAIFGEAEEAAPRSSDTERVNYMLPSRLLEGLRLLSKTSGVPMSRIVERALETAHGPQFEELAAAAAIEREGGPNG